VERLFRWFGSRHFLARVGTRRTGIRASWNDAQSNVDFRAYFMALEMCGSLEQMRFAAVGCFTAPAEDEINARIMRLKMVSCGKSACGLPLFAGARQVERQLSGLVRRSIFRAGILIPMHGGALPPPGLYQRILRELKHADRNRA